MWSAVTQRPLWEIKTRRIEFCISASAHPREGDISLFQMLGIDDSAVSTAVRLSRKVEIHTPNKEVRITHTLIMPIYTPEHQQERTL